MRRIFDQFGDRLGKSSLVRKEKQEEEPEQKFIVHLNSPATDWLQEKSLTVSGWLLACGNREVAGVRIMNGGHSYTLEYGLERHDVAKAYAAEMGMHKALHSGFLGELTFEEGRFEIQADLGDGWETIRELELRYSPEKLVNMLYDPNLSEFMAEHQNLLENKKKYYYEKAADGHYNRDARDPRLITFYLPQYHPIPENDRAWGKGFTEWTNVAAAQPRFVGHQQPLEPTDLGYYDLRVEQTIKEQIDLAQQHGIYGFCFYYYWFSGRRLLDKPLDIFLNHKEWDLPFLIAWANENWTKRWDGLDDDVIVAQKYLETDPLQFIKDVEDILLDPRYIRQDGKPVLIVYRGSRLKDPAKYIKIWREYFRKQHNQELHILSILGLDIDDPALYGFDAAIEFEPLTIAKRTDFGAKEPVPRTALSHLIDKNFSGGLADYRQVALDVVKENNFPFSTYKSLMPSWDNDARKKGKGSTIFSGSNPDIYGKWLDNVLAVETQKTDAPMVFINAWNEWAEGTVLEPTKHNGHALLNRTTEILAKYSAKSHNTDQFPLYGITRKKSTKLAVVVHVFYEEEWLYIENRLRMLEGIEYDLFITLSARCESVSKDIRAKHVGVHIWSVPNRGRDMLPFLFAVCRLQELGYESVLKLHTKRSTHRQDGKDWFESMVEDLLPTKQMVKAIVAALGRGVPLIGPSGHYISLQRYMGSNHTYVHSIVSQLYDEELADIVTQRPETYGYFAGSMFWLRIDAIQRLLNMMPIPEDFEAERGQIDGTYAHAIERMISILPTLEGGQPYESSKSDGIKVVGEALGEEYSYAP